MTRSVSGTSLHSLPFVIPTSTFAAALREAQRQGKLPPQFASSLRSSR
jgi:hypothetical protein